MKLLYRILIISVISLLMIGVSLVLSASSTYSFVKFDSFYHLFNSHLFKVIIAGAALAFFMVFPYEKYKKYSKPALFLTVVLLVFTLITAPEIKGAGRWINLGPFSFQPSEMAKLVLIAHIAALIEKKKQKGLLDNYKLGFLIPYLWIMLIAALIFLQPNVSNSVIVALVGVSMLYVGGARFGYILSSSLPIIVTGAIGVMILPHSRDRIMAYYNSFVTGNDINIQVRQAKIALGSGGFFGAGLGNSRQSDLFLPESYGDFIYSIVGEEFGFVGAFGVLLLYLGIFLIGILIAKKAKDEFGQLLAFGISFSIIANAFINAAVVMGLFPTTGIPLPFISYGGTSVIFSAAAIGILINIAKRSMVDAEKINRLAADGQR
jgi:cell division protein FtsW